MNTDTLPRLKRESAGDANPIRILIVEDEPDQCAALALRLKKQGYQTLTATTGREGLALAEQEQPDLVLLDVGLPDMDGLDVCAQLVDAVPTCGIPIVIVSAGDKPDIVRRCRAAGGEYFVRKPYDPNVLLTLVQKALEHPFL